MSEPITEQELEQIEVRRREAVSDNPWVDDTYGAARQLAAEDVPRLIAEVRRIRGLFSEEDVDALRCAAVESGQDWEGEDAGDLRGLADRIAATLPPREGGST